MSVLITGANGFIGRHLTRYLQQSELGLAEATVPAVRSAAVSNSLAVFGVDTSRLEVYGDMAAPLDWSKHLYGIQQVVHCAGVAHRVGTRSQTTNKVSYFDVINTQAAAALAKAAAACGVKRLVFISSVSVYGVNQSDECLDESTPPAPTTAYGHSKWQAEQLLHEISYATGIEVVIIRPALTFGYDAPANMHKLMRLAASPLWLPFASVDNRRHLLSVQNFCEFIGALCASEHLPARSVEHLQAGTTAVLGSLQNKVHTVNLADSEAVSLAQILTALRDGMGMQPKLLSVPPVLLRTGLELTGKALQAQQLFGNLRISNQRACRLVNWNPRNATLDALRETGAQYRQGLANK